MSLKDFRYRMRSGDLLMYLSFDTLIGHNFMFLILFAQNCVGKWRCSHFQLADLRTDGEAGGRTDGRSVLVLVRNSLKTNCSASGNGPCGQ